MNDPNNKIYFLSSLNKFGCKLAEAVKHYELWTIMKVIGVQSFTRNLERSSQIYKQVYNRIFGMISQNPTQEYTRIWKAPDLIFRKKKWIYYKMLC